MRKMPAAIQFTGAPNPETRPCTITKLPSATIVQALGGQLKPGLRTTPIRIQVGLGQGSADLLMTVVVFVHNPGLLPSPNGVPFQSAPSPTDAGEVNLPSGMCLVGGVSRNLSLLD